VAILGLVAAIASLGWQAATFFLSGSRVKVALGRGALGRAGPNGATGRIFAPLNATDEQMADIARQGFTEELLVVRVRNVGRLPVDVESVDAYFQGGWGISEPGFENHPLPIG